jgi:DNA primase small subunit
LHGKTGFKVVRIEVDELKEFDPLRDAVVLPDDPVEIVVHREVSIDMNDQAYHLEEGRQKVPTYLAVFLLGRKEATLA